jgi:hypothetical protein
MFLLKLKLAQWYGKWYALLVLQNLNLGLKLSYRDWETGRHNGGPFVIGWQQPHDQA